MIILGVDSSSKTASCAVLQKGKILAENFVNNGMTHSQTLLPLISQTLKAANVTVSELGLIAVTKGPGSFTGLRIGMSTVKGMAAVNNTPCVGVSSLKAAAVSQLGFDGIICAVMDARCNQVYNALFSGDGSRLCEDRALLIPELSDELKKLNKPVIFVGDGADLCYNTLKQQLKNVSKAEDPFVKGSCVAILGRKAEGLSADKLNPVYLRLPQAQRELLAKNKQKGLN
ncbi:MAG: tRNA (adenosine(37)-N6)-threonylcarbamoyltransferase complex dimerization subunit type 1 TsaB [Clostridia bacterium]|nr:tRNA (adenosine(37)-N6)-threonylcarbamoyltransferase complex dimerization subunit type 1 TsaB [Clostridia bacterium]